MRSLSAPTATRVFAIGLALLSGRAISAEQIIPTDEGMSWRYQLTEEAGEGFRLSDANSTAGGKISEPVVYRIRGVRDLDGRKLLEFEMHRSGKLTNTDLITVDEHGIQCWARVDGKGAINKLGSPQTIVASPLGAATKWDFDGEISGEKVHQHYQVTGEEDITVPAGKFHAVHIHAEQTLPGRMLIDRWFVPGTGIVKDTTETQTETHQLLRRISIELSEGPKIAPRPQIRPQMQGGKIKATVATEAVGAGTGQFRPFTPKIYARWQGNDLPFHAKIRALWIAEDVAGVAPPDYTIDEATTIATAPDSHGIFTLERSESGWSPGIYRVEFYVDERLADAVKLQILK